MNNSMTSRAPNTFHHLIGSGGDDRDRYRSYFATSDLSLQMFPPQRHSNLSRTRGGFISVPGKLTNGGSGLKPTSKLLLNVNLEGSLGPVQVVMLGENTVRDLIKAAIEIYVKEKRRPLLREMNPECFRLHYSQFSLQSLKAEEKLMKLGSRNFFLCLKPSTSSVNSCFSSRQADGMAIKFPFPLVKFMEFLL